LAFDRRPAVHRPRALYAGHVRNGVVEDDHLALGVDREVKNDVEDQVVRGA
jgi:hypothetical protein